MGNGRGIVGRSLRVYVAAFLLIAAMSIAGRVILARALERQLNVAEIVNRAGRQRMLATRVIMLTEAARHADSRARYILEHDRDSALQEWNHASSELRRRFIDIGEFDGLRALEASAPDRLAIADLLMKGASFDRLRVHQRAYVRQLDRLLQDVENRSRDQVETTEWLDRAILAATLSVLLVEALLLFLPLLRRVDETFNDSESRRQELTLAQEALSREHEFIEAVLDSAGCLVIVVDREGKIHRWNDECERVTGWTDQDVLGQRFWDVVILPEEHAAVAEVFDTLIAGKYPTEMENHWRTRNGEPRLLHFRNTTLRDETGQVRFIVGMAIDVTEVRALETEARADAALREAMLEHAQALIIATDPEGTIVTFNRAAEEALGYSSDEVVGHHTPLLFHDVEEVEERSRRWGTGTSLEAMAEQCSHGQTEWQYIRRDGSRFVVVQTVSILRGVYGEITGYLGLAHDVSDRRESELRIADQMDLLSETAATLQNQGSELRRANARLEEMARTDGLTGLANHREFQRRLEEEVGRAERDGLPLSMLLLDVDDFKGFNDAFGHPAGDEVLRRVAAVLRSAARTFDLCARYGGEEFAVILPGADSEAAVAAAERMREQLAQGPWTLRPVTASFGVATLVPHLDERATLVSRADRGLYRAKRGGRDRVEWEGLVQDSAGLTDFMETSTSAKASSTGS